MNAWGNIRPAGYAATAAEILDEAAADGDGQDLAARQLAALQGIGYALLALGDQLADAIDAAVTCSEHLAEIVTTVEYLHRVPQAGRMRCAVARLARLWKGGLR
jgi:hypothetical protein